MVKKHDIQERNTKTKKKVEDIFIKTKKPITLKELYLKVNKSLPQIAYSTVYRILQSLEKSKKVIRTNWRDRGALYEWSDRPHHHHLICEKCDSIEDIENTPFCFDEIKMTKDTGYMVTNHSLEFTGICKPCQNKK